jgi:hypothetical protein
MLPPGPTVTGYAPSWGGSNAYAPMFNRSSIERRASQVLAQRGARTLRAAMRALNGAAPGATAIDSYRQVAAQTPFAGGNSGLVPTELVTTINRATTAADRDYINAQVIDQIFFMSPLIGSYASDISGNAGGGKLGY